MEFFFDREESTNKSECKAITGRKNSTQSRNKPVWENEKYGKKNTNFRK